MTVVFTWWQMRVLRSHNGAIWFFMRTDHAMAANTASGCTELPCYTSKRLEISYFGRSAVVFSDYYQRIFCDIDIDTYIAIVLAPNTATSRRSEHSPILFHVHINVLVILNPPQILANLIYIHVHL